MRPTQLPPNVEAALNNLVSVSESIHGRTAKWSASVPQSTGNAITELFDDGAQPTYAQFREVVTIDMPPVKNAQAAEEIEQVLRAKYGEAWSGKLCYNWHLQVELEGVEPFEQDMHHSTENSAWLGLLMRICWYIHFGNTEVEASWLLEQAKLQGQSGLPVAPVFQTIEQMLEVMGTSVDELARQSRRSGLMSAILGMMS